METPIIILAAGNSSRLGQAKQLLPKGEGTLLSYVVKECIEAKLGEVLVVLGSEADQMRSEIELLNCMILVNEQWQKGQGSSIACAAQSLSTENIAGVFIVLVDQVHFRKENLFKLLKEQKQSKASIVLSQYEEGAGPPSFFTVEHFPALAKLSGALGAKPIVQTHKAEVTYVSFPKGHIDIDTPEDLRHLEEE